MMFYIFDVPFLSELFRVFSETPPGNTESKIDKRRNVTSIDVKLIPQSFTDRYCGDPFHLILTYYGF